MTGEIVNDLAAASRMADVNRILQVEMIRDGLQIIGVVVHVVSAAGLSRAAMAASIGRNDAIAFAEEKKHLRIPIVRRQRLAVTKNNGLTFAPVLEINLRSV